jgi:hypothetical protein
LSNSVRFRGFAASASLVKRRAPDRRAGHALSQKSALRHL